MKAVIYARGSSTTDRQNTDRQVSDLTAYAVGMNYEVCEVFMEHVSGAKKNLMTLLDGEGKPSMIAPVMIAILSTCAELERDNIQYRLQSGCKNYRKKGGKVGRKKGSTKTREQLEEEYKQVLKELRRGTSISRTAKLCDTSTATVARLKKKF